jgi:hypothetical protein
VLSEMKIWDRQAIKNVSVEISNTSNRSNKAKAVPLHATNALGGEKV